MGKISLSGPVIPPFLDWDPLLSYEERRRSSQLRDDVRTHARFIRDTLPPILIMNPKLSSAHDSTLRMIFDRLEKTTMTVELIRYSRIEKALLLMAETRLFPPTYAKQATDMLAHWEEQLGSLKNIRADLWAHGGRLEGVRRIENSLKLEDDAKSAWKVEVGDSDRAYMCGALNFQVGQWWLKPAAAYRDGIIDASPHAITADTQGAYAILLTGDCEHNLKRNGQFVYNISPNDPNKFKLLRTMTNLNQEDKVVRILRSSKLRSRLAPRYGVKYDGLYRVISYSVKLLSDSIWRVSVTLSRFSGQPPIMTDLPSDVMDDWMDYQHFKLQKLSNPDDDFDMLREIARGPLRTQTEVGESEKEKSIRAKPRGSSFDSGYSSLKSPDIRHSNARSSDFQLMVEGTPSPESTL